MKQSDVHHITFHRGKTAVLLSVPAATTTAALRSQLVGAFSSLPSPPATADDLQVWEDKEAVEGAEGPAGVQVVTDGSVKSLGWPRWKRLYVSVRGADGSFAEPEYSVPDPTDGDEEE